MDFEEDSWSYSDPSLESLTLNDQNTETKPQSKPPIEVAISTSSDESKAQLKSPIHLQSESFSNGSTSSLSVSSSPSKATPVSATALLPGREKPFTSNQQTLIKSAPADPLITKHDVESNHISNSSSSSINETASDLVQAQNQLPTQLTPSSNNNFFNNMFSNAASSLSFNRNTPDTPKRLSTGGTGDIDTTLTDDTPNMLSYRRSTKKDKKRNFSLSSISSPLNEDTKPYIDNSDIAEDIFDSNLYVDEKFRDTSQRYASTKRNEEFHKLFKSIPEHERLLDDYSCAISREILLQGRLYVTEYNICFNSNLLVWVTNLVIPFNEISGFEKSATVGLFNYGITINLKNSGKHSFASFISRDATIEKLEEIWKAANQHDSEVPGPAKTFLDAHGAAFISKDISLGPETYDKEYTSALMSIDGDTPKPRRSYSTSEEEYNDDNDDDDIGEEEEEEDTDESSTSGGIKSEPKILDEKVYKLNANSKTSYDGPSANHPTKCPYDPEANKETILANLSFNCPPGVLFEFLFSENNNSLTLEFLETQDSSEFSEFSAYELNEDNFKERTYQYRKGLNFSVGPKSTRCLVKETLENVDFKGYINVVNTTQTPDVPSGGSFSVKTRYIITWGKENTSNLVVSFWVYWISSSWMKSVIEKSCKSGQDAATKALIEILKRYVEQNIHPEVESVSFSSEDISIEKETEKLEHEPIKEEEITQASIDVTSSFVLGPVSILNIIVLVLLFTILIFQILIFNRLYKIPGRDFTLNSIQKIDPNTEDLIFKGQEVLLWDWINNRAGKIVGSKELKSVSIQNDIDMLINKWATGELDTKAGKLLIKDFEDRLNDYINKSGDIKDEQRLLKTEQLKKSIRALL